jgi:hypothetical protein
MPDLERKNMAPVASYASQGILVRKCWSLSTETLRLFIFVLSSNSISNHEACCPRASSLSCFSFDLIDLTKKA